MDAAFDTVATPYVGAVKRFHRHLVRRLDLQLLHRELRGEPGHARALHLAAVAAVEATEQTIW